jgi:hypothetical protein
MSMNTGSGLANPGVIDLVTHDPESDEYALIMVQAGPWDDPASQFDQIVAKTNTYLAFAQGGQLASIYPASVGKPVRFQLDCAESPTDQMLPGLDQLTQQLQGLQFRFVINVMAAARND